MTQQTPNKVTLSFTSKSKKISSSLNLRQQSISKHRDNESQITQSVTNITHNLSNHNNKKQKQKIIPLIKQNKWRKPTTNPPPLEQDPSTSLTTQQQEAIDLISASLNPQNTMNTSILAPNISNPSSVLTQMQLNQAPGINEICDPTTRARIDIAQRPSAPDSNEYNSMSIFNYGEALLRGMGWNNNTPIGNQYGTNQLKIPKQINIAPRPKGLGLGALLTKEEADALKKKKFNPKKQRTKSEKRRMNVIDGYTEKDNNINKYKIEQPIKKKRKIEYKKIKWIMNGLRVRCVKENCQYFKQKGIINDIIDEYRFEMLVDNKDKKNKSILVTLYECDVDTVIPKKGELVMVLKGKYKKEKGCIWNKNKKEQYAMVQLQSDLSIVKCYYDDICAI